MAHQDDELLAINLTFMNPLISPGSVPSGAQSEANPTLEHAYLQGDGVSSNSRPSLETTYLHCRKHSAQPIGLLEGTKSFGVLPHVKKVQSHQEIIPMPSIALGRLM